MMNEKTAALSAILFLNGEALERDTVKDILDVEDEELDNIILQLTREFNSFGMPYEILKLDSRIQMAVKERFLPYVQKLKGAKKNQPLTQAALEVLAIIAYNQPVTRSFVEQVRGVNSNNVLNSLLEKGYIEEAGRLDLPGRPISYKTTDSFLRGFGMQSLEELPQIS